MEELDKYFQYYKDKNIYDLSIQQHLKRMSRHAYVDCCHM